MVTVLVRGVSAWEVWEDAAGWEGVGRRAEVGSSPAGSSVGVWERVSVPGEAGA